MQIENYKLRIANSAHEMSSLPPETSLPQGMSSVQIMQTGMRLSSDQTLALGRFVRDYASPAARIGNFQFSIFNFQFFSRILLFVLLFAPGATAQIVPDKIVASVTNGSQAAPDVITYSDIVWQVALEPNEPSPARPSSDQLKQALDLLVQQSLVLQEAKKLPLSQSAEAQVEFDKQVQEKLRELIQHFGSRAHLEDRMKQVGLTAEQLDQILRDRVMMDRYIDFRFKAFAIVTDKEIQDRYERDYRRPRNGQIAKTLEEVRATIEHDLTQEKIGVEIDNFIDRLRDQPGTEIVILNPV